MNWFNHSFLAVHDRIRLPNIQSGTVKAQTARKHDPSTLNTVAVVVSQSVEHEEHEQSRGEAGNKKEEVTDIPASAPSSANHVLTKYVNPNVTRLRLEEEAEGQQHCLSFWRRSALRGLMMSSRTH